MLQKSLKLVLGSHIEQAGSYVDSKRLRFDFTHFEAITTEDITKIEKLVNDQIYLAEKVIIDNKQSFI